MPGRNAVKKYVSDGYYHVYNHGVGNMLIFKDEGDYATFLYLLEEYLCRRKLKNTRKSYYNKVFLLSFCLLDNHFHFLLKQSEERVIDRFMKSLITSYVLRYNKKYYSRGRLFESVYRARLLENENDLINVSKYIHMNPDPLSYENSLRYPYSSLREYIDSEKSRLNINFVSKNDILLYFNGSNKEYKFFLCKGFTHT